MNKYIWLLSCCTLALLTVGCGAQPIESSVTEEMSIASEATETTATETIATEAATETETDGSSETATDATIAASDTEPVTEPETEVSPEDAALTDMAIDLTQKALSALKNQNTDEILAYTNYPMLYYMTLGKDPEENREDMVSRMEEQYPQEGGNAVFMFGVFDGAFTISRVEHSTELTEKFADFIRKEQEEMEEGTSSRLEKYPIEDVITVYGTMTYDNKRGDTGAVFLLKMNGEWKFDACYSFSMEMQGEWDDVLTE